MKCCCGKRELVDTVICVVNNDIQHELPGEDRFCGPVAMHALRDARKDCDMWRERSVRWATELDGTDGTDGLRSKYVAALDALKRLAKVPCACKELTCIGADRCDGDCPGGIARKILAVLAPQKEKHP